METRSEREVYDVLGVALTNTSAAVGVGALPESNTLLSMGHVLQDLTQEVADLARRQPEIQPLHRALGSAAQLVISLAYLQGAVEFAVRMDTPLQNPEPALTYLRPLTFRALLATITAGEAWSKRLEAKSR